MWFQRTVQMRYVFIVVIFILGLCLRLWQSQALPGFSFQDGGRDVLVAKRIVHGQASFDVAPASAAIIPNTPLPYWTTAFWYAVGGLWGVLSWHVLAGVGVMMMAYLTTRMIAGEHAGWIALVIAALSPELIRLSQMIWPTHTFVFIYALSLFLFLSALKKQELKWYWWSVFSLWLVKMLHASELPVAIVMEVMLGWSIWQMYLRKSLEPRQVWYWVGGVVMSWMLWMMLSFGVVGQFNWHQSGSEFEQFVVGQSVSQMLQTMVSHLQFTTQFVTLRFSSWFWGYMLLGLFWMWFGANHVIRGTTLYMLRVLGILFATVLATCFSPSGQVSNWYVTFQSYVLVLLVSVFPISLSRYRFWQVASSVVLVAVVLQQNWFWLSGHLSYPVQGTYADSLQVAKLLVSDSKQEGYSPVSSTLLLFEVGEEGKSYRIIGQEWRTSSIQLALEEIDAEFVQRVRIVPWAENWSNIIQPFHELYYVVCPVVDGADGCVGAIDWDGEVSTKLIGEFWASSNQVLKVYRVKRLVVSMPVTQAPMSF